MEKRRSQLILNLLSKKDPYNDENDINFRLSDIKEENEEDIGLANFLRDCKSKMTRKFSKKVTGWLFDDCGII